MKACVWIQTVLITWVTTHTLKESLSNQFKCQQLVQQRPRERAEMWREAKRAVAVTNAAMVMQL